MKGDITKLKAALLKADRKTHWLQQGHLYPAISAPMTDFASKLRKLFKQAYPSESTTSNALLQRFLTGLRSLVGQQLLLCEKLDDLTEAIESVSEVEYASILMVATQRRSSSPAKSR